MPGVIVPGPDGPPRQQGSQLCGRILWLPKKEWIKVAGDKLDEGSLELKHPHDLRARSTYLPIKPCNPHPDNRKLLVLEDQTQRLRKNSYVKTKDQKVVTYANLRPYERKTPDVVFALSRKSYQDLIEYAEYSAPLPDITRIDSNTICSPPLPLPPRAEAIAVARPYIDLSYDSVDAVSAARRMGVSRVHSPVRQNTSARRDDARRPVANTAAAAVAAPTHARPEVSLEHMRYQLALEAINEYRRSQIRTAASSHTRSSIGTYTHSHIPAERRTLLPVHNQDSYGGYRHYNYGSTPRLLFWLVDECKSLWDTVSHKIWVTVQRVGQLGLSRI
ncbi:hypothetical protein UCREL1_7058 [Eutypa lata UCREL1]|uniref:Uncharacterized protein n=1 Tax=Eutypa lata (strain UCR-EL1) TaxID=1287681 RepID=M7SI24_EUTLA|nr:hypothetical protein UCREL1_7058 [Eutypa lata UCREL1]